MSPNRKTINNRIRELRATLGLTQEELALKLGLKGKSSIANYESGKISPSDEIKLKMCKLFNCSMDYLMGATGFKTSDDFYRQMDYTFRDIFYNKYVLLLSELGLSNNDIKNVLNIYFVTPKYTDLVDDVNVVINENNRSLKNILKNYPLDVQKKVLNFINDFLKSKRTVLTEVLKDTKSNIKTNKLYACPVYGRISAGMPNWAEECIEGRLPIDPNMMGIVDPEECYFLRVNGESMNKVIRNGAYALIRKTDWVENGEIAVVLVNGFDATLKKFTKNGDVVVLEPISDDPTIQTQIYTKDTPIKIIGKYIGKFEMK